MENINIKTSKGKLVNAIIVSLIFGSLSIIMIVMPNKLTSFLFRSQELILVIGITTLIFSVVAILYLCKRLFGNNAAITVDEKGVYDNTNISSIGLILWDDIINIHRIKSASNFLLLIKVKNANKYISKSKNFLQKRTMKMNYRLYKTPITINSGFLECSFDELEDNIQNYFMIYKKNNS